MSVYIRCKMKWTLENFKEFATRNKFEFVKTPFRCRAFSLFSLEGKERSVHFILGKNGGYRNSGYRTVRYFLEGVEVTPKYFSDAFLHDDVGIFVEGKCFSLPVSGWVPV